MKQSIHSLHHIQLQLTVFDYLYYLEGQGHIDTHQQYQHAQRKQHLE